MRGEYHNRKKSEGSDVEMMEANKVDVDLQALRRGAGEMTSWRVKRRLRQESRATLSIVSSSDL